MRFGLLVALGLTLAPHLAFAQDADPSPVQRLNEDFQAVTALSRAAVDGGRARLSAERTLLESINKLVQRNIDLEKEIAALKKSAPPEK